MVPVVEYSTVNGIPVPRPHQDGPGPPRSASTPSCSAPARAAARSSACSRPVRPSTRRPPGIAMAEAYLNDQKRVLPCAAYVNGEYGVDGSLCRRAGDDRRGRCRKGCRDRMSILVNKNTKVITQGMTGATGTFHTEAGAGLWHADGRRASPPARAAPPTSACPSSTPWPKPRPLTGATASCIYVPPPFAADSILEAIDAEMELIVCITEGIPVLDMVKVKRALVGLQVAPDRPELPRRADPERMQDRHHARQHLQGARSASSALGHAHL
jgi:hypothetical protein